MHCAHIECSMHSISIYSLFFMIILIFICACTHSWWSWVVHQCHPREHESTLTLLHSLNFSAQRTKETKVKHDFFYVLCLKLIKLIGYCCCCCFSTSNRSGHKGTDSIDSLQKIEQNWMVEHWIDCSFA